MQHDLGKWLMIAGTIALAAGVLLYFFHDKLHWVGKLPGDIRIEKENFRFYFPFTTLVIISLLMNIIIRLIKRFFL